MAERDRKDTVGKGSQALVVRQTGGTMRHEERPLSGFLTQLIACARRLPAYRAARQMEPAGAASRYDEPAAAGFPGFERVV